MTGETSRDFATALQDRYQLERELGQGGMATVYLALEVRHRRHVALKVLRPQIAESLGEGRFLREIEVTARLQHPHILPVFDSGETTGSLWYTMPYVEGMSLRDRMTRDRQLPIPLALKITREIADALDYAHRHGVVHRDVKPENILLSEDHALLADLGIAKAVATNETTLTSTGMAVGTPAYMSPEQVAGDSSVDGRSDLYSLACVTYEMLTGEPPHLGKTAQAIAMKRLTEAPPSARRLRATVSEETDAALMQALAVSAADRFLTVRAFADALGEVPGATPASTRAVPVRKRSRATMVTAVAGAFASLTLAGWAIASYSRSGPEKTSDGRPRDEAATVASPTAAPAAPAPVSDSVVTSVPLDTKAGSGVASMPQPTRGTVTRPVTSATDTATPRPKESAPARRRDSMQAVNKCGRLLERVTLGEDLTPADSTFLRTRCGK